MPIISMRCPNCGAELKVNDSLEKLYCNYCGNLFILPEAMAQKQVIDETHKVKPFLEIAETSLGSKDFARCAEYADRAIEIDGRNAYAWYLKGCGSEGMRRGSGEIFFLRARDYCSDPALGARISRALADPDSHVPRQSRKLKVDMTAADKRFMKDKFSIYLDKEKVAVVQGGDIMSVPLEQGKHEVSVRVNSQMAKAFKRRISVEDNNYRLKVIKDKDKSYSWDLDEM
jgi:predicted RNA-binding Zn-ribbon protein involved in translation (DUF1610 family)